MDRRLLLAGSVGPERVPVRPSDDDARWYEPLHVRDEARARERIASQVGAGADVVVAPTWLTHRRALLPIGETRSARAWTTAAVQVARDGVELGLERREEAARAAASEEPTEEADIPRPDPLVAAVLPALDEEAEPGSGRMLPREAATERDYRDQAGLLADAMPELILVAGQRMLAEARLAIEEAAATGLPVWAAAHASLATGTDGGGSLARFVETCRNAGAEALLLPAPVDAASAVVAGSGTRWGGLVEPGDERTSAWLDVGATLIGLLDGATVAALAAPRAAIDRLERDELAADERWRARWTAHVARAASMASGGAALWLGEASAGGSLPMGFDWLLVGAAELARLPTDRFRLIVDAVGDAADLRLLGRCLEQGGVLATPLGGAIGGLEGLRLLSIDDEAEPPLAILRREG